MLEFGNNKDIIIVDKEGFVVHFDLVNPKNFEGDRADARGRHILSLYSGADETYPLLRALRTKKAVLDYEYAMPMRGSVVHQLGSAFPIMHGEDAVGAVEVSECFYGKADLEEFRNHAQHPIYRKNGTKYVLKDIVTADPKMLEIKAEIERVALSDSTVLIYGKTGTGKELVAHSIHNASNRYSKRFLSQNCSAIPMQLLESLLFGTTKGSFTGAKDKPGLFELANGGTLFLDEINSLHPSMQVKLLKVISDKKVRRVGGLHEINLDVRLVAATNEPLERLLHEGRMREDLYYRLAVLQMELPDLIERGDDISLLTEYFVGYYNKKLNSCIKMPGDHIMRAFSDYDWPGNVRELRNIIEGAFVFAETDEIIADDIPDHIMKRRATIGKTTFAKPRTSECGIDHIMKEAEAHMISAALRQSAGSLTEASKRLGISKQLLKYKRDALLLRRDRNEETHVGPY